MKVKSIAVWKVRTATVKDSVKKAVLTMTRYNIGSVVITEGEEPVGIITERDILRRIVAKGKDAAKIRCKEVMSKPLITIEAEDSIEDAIVAMSKKKIKRLVVARSGRLAGIVTVTDILRSGEKIEYVYLKKLAEFFPVYDENAGQAG